MKRKLAQLLVLDIKKNGMNYKFRDQKRPRGNESKSRTESTNGTVTGKSRVLVHLGNPQVVLMTAGAFAEFPPLILTRSSMFQLLDGPVRISQ